MDPATLLGVATCGLYLLGFGSAGVIAGYIAGAIQSLIGSVAHGSLFALMQIAGAMAPYEGTIIHASVAVGVATCGLYLLGFGSAGVIAGSIAGAIQSLIGSVARGSLFALMQIAGAMAPYEGTIRIYALGGVVGAAAAVGVATCGLHLLGFGNTGVIAGSIAAGIQSLIGSVARGSLFALMQSAGAVGLASRSKTAWAIGGGIAVVTVLYYLL